MGRFFLLVGEGDEDVFVSAGARCHVLLLIVKLVVAALRASDQLGERVVLANNGRSFSETERVHFLIKRRRYFYHSRDERQGTGVISNGDKFVTF